MLGRNGLGRNGLGGMRAVMNGRSTAIWLALWLPASLGIHEAAFALATHVRAHVDPPLEAPVAKSTAASGDTFDIDPDRVESEPSSSALSEQTESSPGETKNVPRSHGSPGKTAQSSPPPTDEVFGAEGDRSAVDLATSFTRAFPQTASADPIWASVPLGETGSVDVVLEIDDAGNLVSSEVRGAGSAALRRASERTIALLRHRLFTAHARRTTLLVSASVSPDSVHDGLHGDVFALGGSFSQTEGDAFFALAIGRRIDVRIASH